MENKGFTLIELILIITIMAILGTIAFIPLGVGNMKIGDVEKCSSNEIRTKLSYHGMDIAYKCLSKDAYNDVLIYKCTRRIADINNSMSNTWGNDEYNTESPTKEGYNFMKECIESYKN